MSLRIMDREITRVSVIEDDAEARKTYGYSLDDLSLQAIPEVGPLDNLQLLLQQLARTTEAALCDYHLKKRSYARFNGDEIVVECYKKSFPAILCTTFTDSDSTLLRGRRRFIPTLLKTSELNPDSIKKGFEQCVLEFKGQWRPSRKPWRTLVRIEEVDLEGKYFYVVIPGWNVREKIRISLEDVPEIIKPLLVPEKRLHAQVNLGVESHEQLYFDGWEQE
jgi:hypothetical protein